MKYREWLGQWLELYIKPSVKSRTYDKYACAVRLYIQPHLGEYTPSELSVTVLQEFVNTLLGTDRGGGIGLSANTVSDIISMVQQSLDQAVNTGIVERHCAGMMCRPKSEEANSKVNCFAITEQRRIEEYVFLKKDLSLYGILLTMYTGLRIGELLALTWDDIDMKRCLMTVSKTCRDSWGGGYTKLLGSPKTPSSYRIIPIPRQIMPYIRQMKRKSNCEYVVSRRGNAVSIRSYQRTFARILKKLCIKHLGFHALRHTFATRAIENGMDIKTLADIMGHKSPAITLSTYAHSLAPHKKSMMNKLGKILADGRPVMRKIK